MKIQFDKIKTKKDSITVFDGDKNIVITKDKFQDYLLPENAVPISGFVPNLENLTVTGNSVHKIIFSPEENQKQIELNKNHITVPAMSFTELQAYTFDPNKKYRVHLNQDCMDNIEFNNFLKSKSNIIEIIIDKGTTHINDDTFSNCSNILKVFIKGEIEWIGASAFSCCSSLEYINIPETVTSIYWYAFCECIKLTSIVLPNNIELIDESTFDGCESLREISLGDNLCEIREYAFSYCENLSSIIFRGTKESWECVYYWNVGIPSGCIVHCTDGDITIQ